MILLKHINKIHNSHICAQEYACSNSMSVFRFFLYFNLPDPSKCYFETSHKKKENLFWIRNHKKSAPIEVVKKHID